MEVFFAQPIDVSLIILSCLQNSDKSHESIIRGVQKGGKSKKFCQKTGQKIQIP